MIICSVHACIILFNCQDKVLIEMRLGMFQPLLHRVVLSYMMLLEFFCAGLIHHCILNSAIEAEACAVVAGLKLEGDYRKLFFGTN